MMMFLERVGFIYVPQESVLGVHHSYTHFEGWHYSQDYQRCDATAAWLDGIVGPVSKEHLKKQHDVSASKGNIHLLRVLCSLLSTRSRPHLTMTGE
jgi:hypothetical protein